MACIGYGIVAQFPYSAFLIPPWSYIDDVFWLQSLLQHMGIKIPNGV